MRSARISPALLEINAILSKADTYVAEAVLNGLRRTFGIAPPHDSPVSFVVSMNLKRRHMDTSQRAAVAVELEPMYAEEAKARKAQASGKPLGQKSLVANLPQEKAKTRDQAAKAVKVGGRTVSDAKAVKSAAPEKFEKIKAGELTVHAAKKEIKAEREAEAAPEPDVYRDRRRRRGGGSGFGAFPARRSR